MLIVAQRMLLFLTQRGWKKNQQQQKMSFLSHPQKALCVSPLNENESAGRNSALLFRSPEESLQCVFFFKNHT